MKFRESGMPEESYWHTFFDPLTVLKSLGLTKNTELLIDIGSGYGTFALPTATYIKGKVIGLDIDEEMVNLCNTKAANLGIKNATFTIRDVFSEGFGVEPESVDCVYLFNILHCETPLELLNTTFNCLKPGGKALVIHWVSDKDTPRGPSMDIRPKPNQIIDWATQTNFTCVKQLDLKPYHYGLILQK